MVDTLYLSTEGAKPAPWLLDALAQCDRLEGARVTITWDGRAVHGPEAKGLPKRWVARRGSLNGFGAYPYTLHGFGDWHGVTVLIAPPRAEGQAWRWYLMLRSERLWRAYFDGMEAIDVAEHAAFDLGDARRVGLMRDAIPLRLWKVGRIDVCRDHGGVRPWELHDLYRFAKRGPEWSCGAAASGTAADDEIRGDHAADDVRAAAAAYTGDDTGDRWTYGNRDGQTLYLGRRRTESRFLRIYCKTAEAEHSGKASWLEPWWRWALLGDEAGPLPRIWRAEVEHGGGWCRAHGLETADKLRGAAWALWGGYVAAVRHVGDVSKEHRRHAVASDTWRLLQTGARSDVRGWRYTPKPPSTGGDLHQLRKQAAGCAARIIERLIEAHGIFAEGADEDAILAEVMADISERARHRIACGAGPPERAATVAGPPAQAPPGSRSARLRADPCDAEDAFATPPRGT